MKIVKFVGKFKDLIPAGWTFQKLFARNYRQYHKTCDGEKYSQGCSIWQHRGGYLEIADLFSNSSIIVEKISNGTIDELSSLVTCMFDRTKKEKVFYLTLDTKDRVFYPFHSGEYKEIQKMQWRFGEENVSEKDIHAHYERYRSFNLRQETVDMIKDLLDKGWICVEDIE